MKFATLPFLVASCILTVSALPAAAAEPGGGASSAANLKTDPARSARLRAAKMPSIARPVLFHTPEADAILTALEVFPPDNAFNQSIEDWPLHPNSKNIVASIGPEK